TAGTEGAMVLSARIASKVVHALRAELSQVNRRAWACPLCRNDAAKPGSVSASSILAAIDDGRIGSKRPSLRPITSGMLLVADAIAGARRAIASKCGSQDPSCIVWIT